MSLVFLILSCKSSYILWVQTSSDMIYKHFLSLYKSYFNFLDGIYSHTIIFFIFVKFNLSIFFFFFWLYELLVLHPKGRLPTQGESWRFSPGCFTPFDLVLKCRYLTWFQFIYVWWGEKGPASAPCMGYYRGCSGYSVCAGWCFRNSRWMWLRNSQRVTCYHNYYTAKLMGPVIKPQWEAQISCLPHD